MKGILHQIEQDLDEPAELAPLVERYLAMVCAFERFCEQQQELL